MLPKRFARRVLRWLRVSDYDRDARIATTPLRASIQGAAFGLPLHFQDHPAPGRPRPGWPPSQQPIRNGAWAKAAGWSGLGLIA
jgi:hypothetical protein